MYQPTLSMFLSPSPAPFFYPPDFWVFVYDVTASVDRVSKLVSEINLTNEGGEAACFCLLSPNGDLVLTIDDDGQLATWRVEDGELGGWGRVSGGSGGGTSRSGGL